MADNPVLHVLRLLFGLRASDLKKRGSRDAADFSYPELLRNGLDPFTGYAAISQDRIVRYTDFDLMGAYSDLCVALDMYAEESTQTDPKTGKVVWIESEDDDIQKEADTWCRRLRLDDRAYGIARNIAKYGDLFEYLLINDNGIYNMQFIHPTRVARVETDRLVGFQCDDLARLVMRGGGNAKDNLFMPWDFVHFRIETFDRETIYGTSYLESVRKIWKELSILETMIAVYRVTKSVERNIFYVDVADSSPQETKALLERYRQQLRKNQFIDPVTGDFRIDIQAVTPQEDIILPIRGATSGTKIDKLAKAADFGAIEDVQYFRTKLRAALGIPKMYFDQEESGSGWVSGKSLVLQDQRFSRKIQRLQRTMRSGLTRAFAIHLSLRGIKWKPGQFIVKMGSVNQIYQEQKMSWWLERASVAASLLPLAQQAGLDQKKWNLIFLPEIFGLTIDAVESLQKPDPDAAMDPNDPNAAPQVGGLSPVGGAKPAGGGKGGKIPQTIDFPKMPKFGSTLSDEFINMDFDGLPDDVRDSLIEAVGPNAKAAFEFFKFKALDINDAWALTEDIYDNRDEIKIAVSSRLEESKTDGVPDPKKALNLGSEDLRGLTISEDEAEVGKRWKPRKEDFEFGKGQ